MSQLRPSVAIVAIASIALTGCVSAPRETVELADITMEQLAHIETAHRDLARAYFDLLENQVDDFIDNEWAPDFLNRAVQNEEVQQRLEATRLGLDIDLDGLHQTLVRSGNFSAAEATVVVEAMDVAKLEYRVRFSNLMFEFSEAAQREINKVRREWRDRLKVSERQLLSELDLSYSTVKTGHLSIRTYLESVVEVRALQDEIARKLDLLRERDAALESILEISDGLAEGADALNEAIDTVEEVSSGDASSQPLDSDVMNRILGELEN